MAQRDLNSIKRASADLTNDQMLELAVYLLKRVKRPGYDVQKVDLSKFYGTVKFPEDAIEYQKRVRAEWDR
jgi:hypothetical protein